MGTQFSARSPPKKRAQLPNFWSMSVVAKRLNGSIPLGTDVGLGSGDIVLDGDAALL